MTGLRAALGMGSIVGSYQLVKEIGRGGMGRVFEAIHTVLPRRAAVKVMHAELARHAELVTGMVREASILEEVWHPGIARIFDCDVSPDHGPWIAMELVCGEPLGSRLNQRSTIPADETATLVAQVADVLVDVHARGIVHRDLKPDNVLLTPTDSRYPLRVIDWGVARVGPLGQPTVDGVSAGTPTYMSPEQATGRSIGASSDVYALGVIAYEMLTGHPPYEGRTLAELLCAQVTHEPLPLAGRCAAPHELRALVHAMLDIDPNTRPTALEVRQRAEVAPAPTDDGDTQRVRRRVATRRPGAPPRPPPYPPSSSATRAMPASQAITPSSGSNQVSGEITLPIRRFR